MGSWLAITYRHSIPFSKAMISINSGQDRIKVSRGFVGDQHGRRVDERAGNGNTLRLASRQHSMRASALPPRLKSSNNSEARRRISARGRPVGYAGSIAFSIALMPLIRLNCWKMNPKVLRRIPVRNLSADL